MKATTRWAMIGLAAVVAAHGAPITPGNLLAFRVDGNGSALGSDAAIVHVDEYDLAGNLIQTFTMPSGASGTRLTASGTATSEGKLSVSPNGEYIALAGYDAAENTLSVKSVLARTIGVIKRSDGSVDLTTTGNLGGNDNMRSATVADNGSDLWFATAGAGNGPYYISKGGSSGTQLTNVNSRGVRIFGGQLYEWGDAANNYGVYAVGSGLPTSGLQTLNGLPGLSGNPALDTYGFFMADLDSSVPGYDTLWMARDATGVSKYSLVGGTWTLNDTIDPGNVYHIDGLVTPGGVYIAIINNSNIDLLYDTAGYNQPMSGSFTLLVSSATYNAFRGVAFVVPEPSTIGLLALAGGAIAVIRRRAMVAA